jgi:G3E family GTPase
MKIAQITGFLGSGKTTFLIKLAKELESRGNRVALVVNDVGHINVDQKLMESNDLKVKEVAGGCICCQVQGTFTTTVVNLYLSYRPDIILVEPTGVAIPWGLKEAVERSEKQSIFQVEHAPVVTFVDSMMIAEQMQLVRRLVETQIREADAIVINKVDLTPPQEVEEAVRIVQELNSGALILKGSGKEGLGVPELADLILQGASMRYDEAKETDLLKEHYGG